MGKTYKDQKKYEKKHRDDSPKFKPNTSRNRPPKHYDEIIPDDDPLNPYEEYDIEYYDDE